MSVALGARGLTFVCAILYLIWTAGPLMRLTFRPDHPVRRFVAVVRSELNPFMLPILVVGYLADVFADGDPYNPKRIGVFLLNVIFWWTSRKSDDDDDRWKRRRNRLAARVQREGHRLAVVGAR